MNDLFSDWFAWVDELALCLGLVGILWAGLRRSKFDAPPMVLVGLTVWLAAMGVAVFLIIGPDR